MNIVLAGDTFGRQTRDPLGLALRLANRLKEPVFDATVRGGIREVYQSVTMHHVPIGMHFFFLGAVDARGGGISPTAFIEGWHEIRRLESHQGLHRAPITLVFPPPCPVSSDGGYAKGSRRWLERMGGFLREEVEKPSNAGDPGLVPWQLLIPEISANGWSNQLNLTREGMTELTNAIVRVRG